MKQPITRMFARAVPGSALVIFLLGCAGSGPVTVAPEIFFDASVRGHGVSQLIFGANHRWVSDGVGSVDPVTGITYPKVIEQIRDTGISMIRYPAGTLANTFEWSKAVGPQVQRGFQVGGLARLPMPQSSTFGPDEYGKLLDATGTAGDLMLNFATADPADAAGFVAYMSALPGGEKVNGIDWAARRAANGHVKPYEIAYAEIGNEYDPLYQAYEDELYWIKGEPVQIDATCAESRIECLYAFGGSTRFVRQPVVSETDWRAGSSVSNGTAGQIFYARFAPVTPKSETIYVNGDQWFPAQDLARVSKGEDRYSIDNRTGAIRFGDNVHGAIPPKGSIISLTYTSGPHGGFVDYYRAIKAVNPKVKVCTSIFDTSFIRIMGSEHAYDCVAAHPYAMVDPSRVTGPTDFYGQSMLATGELGRRVQTVQNDINRYAGANSSAVSLLLSEYGQVGRMPSFAPHFTRSLGEAVMQGLFLRQWILQGIEAADRHALVDYTFGAAPPDLALLSNADNVVLQGPGPDTIETPTALAIQIFKRNVGSYVVPSDVKRNPTLTWSNGKSIGALQTIVTADSAGTCYVIVMNLDPANAIKAHVSPRHLVHDSTAAISVLFSANILDENNPAKPTAVRIVDSTIHTGKDEFEHVFPAHSITAIRLSKAEIAGVGG